MKKSLDSVIVVFDTETTGLMKPDPVELYKQPFMTEFYGIKIRLIEKEKNVFTFEKVDEFYTLTKPPVPVSEKITEITGITNDELRTAPKFIEIYPKLADFFLGTYGMVAHNCSFDRDIILGELRRHGLEYNFPWPIQHICTVEKTECIENKRLNLQKLYKLATGKDAFPNAHRAKADVMALVECVVWCKNNNFI